MFGEIQVAHYRHVMGSSIAGEVADLFRENYPTVESEENRVKDIAEHKDSIKILELLREGRSFYLARQFGGVALTGFIESRTHEADEIFYEQMTWIMVDEHFRGTGVASSLHGAFIDDATGMTRDRSKPTVAQLSVHKNNVSAREIYAKWGYRDIGETQDGQSIFMIKDLEV